MPHTHPVLIAEDDEDTVFLLQRYLRKAGIRNPVKIVNDGMEALAYLEDEVNHKTPRLAVLDIRMPLRDGFEVLKQVRANPKLKLMPVIIFSSSNSDADMARAYELGANSYVVKPHDTKAMDEVLGMIQQYWLEVNKAPGAVPCDVK